jgi:TonB family protein
LGPAPTGDFVIRRLLPLALLVAAPLAGQRGSPSSTDRCPLPAEARGYPVSAAGADAPLPAGFATALADAAARRWEPPSRGRNRHAGLGGLRSRLQPPEPRFPDDWAPAERHVARLEATLLPGGRVGRAEVAQPSGDAAFDRSLAGALRGGAPAAPSLPELPEGLDSLRVVLVFGAEPPEGAAAVRFAAQQSPVRVVPGTLVLTRTRVQGAPRGPDPVATVKYDVDATGGIVPGSIEVLQSTDTGFATGVREALQRARFTPAQSNCRAVPLSVVQRFGGR